MKKLMLLGGLRYLVPVIKAAKEMGHHVITCDYLPDNIAHKYSDEYCNVSITDKEAVLKVAKQLNIDGIMSFAVDPGVATAAYVSEQLNLPSAGPYKSIQILQNKGLFREFLEKHNFNVPKSKSYNQIDKALQSFDYFDLPVIVKPVDSAGSKGVSKVTNEEELETAIKYALQFSESKSFIIEEFLEIKGFSSDSDCFSVEGEFTFVSFSGQRFDSKSPNPYTPSAYSWPSTISDENQEYLKKELQRLISLLNMNSSLYNIEVRVTEDYTPYIMEVSPRGGGNRLSEMLLYSTGVDLISRAIQAALGEEIDTTPKTFKYNGYWAEIILYSNVAGRFKELKIVDQIRDNIVEIDLRVENGDNVKAFTAANDAIGTIVLKFENPDILDYILVNYTKFIKIIVK